jgi:hypothetical protein
LESRMNFKPSSVGGRFESDLKEKENINGQN